jgi:hypothetical protein
MPSLDINLVSQFLDDSLLLLLFLDRLGQGSSQTLGIA